jgi:hypothetical protein
LPRMDRTNIPFRAEGIVDPKPPQCNRLQKICRNIFLS